MRPTPPADSKLSVNGVRLYPETQAEEWDSFIRKSPDGNFYQRYGWAVVNHRNFGHTPYFLAVVANGEIQGALPLIFIKSRLFGRILCSMPFVNYGGVAADDPNVSDKLIQAAGELAADVNADYVEFRSPKLLCDSLPTSDAKVSMALELASEPDTIWNSFKTKHRTNIRRAYKEGFQVKHGSIELLNDFYKTLAISWKSLGTPLYRQSYFSSVLATFHNEIRIFVVYKDGIPVAAALNGYYKGTVEGMWAGTNPSYRHLQPNYVLYWAMIEHACENGFQIYHFGRSTTDSTGETFKKKWNAIPMQLYWQYHLHRAKTMPQLNVRNPRYKLAIDAWQRLPVHVTNFIGPLIAKSIP